MDKRLKIPSIIVDLKSMGILFPFPIIILILILVYTYITKMSVPKSTLSLEYIKIELGYMGIPLISIWVASLYKDLVDSPGKELLLSLPYGLIGFGLVRVLRVVAIYTFILFCSFLFLQTKCKDMIKQDDYYMPFVSLLFFSAITFVIILITKNFLVCCAIIGVFSTFEYMTRGGLSGLIYPFQWSNPKPMTSNTSVEIALFMSSIVLFFFGQYILSKKEYLVK